MTTNSVFRVGQTSLWLRFSVVAGAFVALVASVVAQAKPPVQPAAAQHTAPDAALIARGDYLTHSVAMCVQCHSPRDERGSIIESREFTGGAIPVRSPWANKDWAFLAPNISGLPGFTDEQVISLLMTGRMSPDRPAPKGPMPPFRMQRAEAEAIVAYLRSR
jgi:mono/diheme cytochrome c family protein